MCCSFGLGWADTLRGNGFFWCANGLRAPRVAARGLLLLAVLMLVPLPAVAKYASIVIDADTGAVLHEVNADTRNYPASLTKIMTLYMVFEALGDSRLKLDDKLQFSVRATRQPPSKLGLGPADTITVENAILALVTKSANDVAVVIAEALGVTEKRFARLMTNKALALGMSRTSFRNASGLPNKGQLSSARDMSILAQAMLRDFPELYGYFSTRRFTYRGATYRNHNKLLGKYDGMDGIKTGYIRASGYNLVASVEREGRRLIAVVFGGESGASPRPPHGEAPRPRICAHQRPGNRRRGRAHDQAAAAGTARRDRHQRARGGARRAQRPRRRDPGRA